MNSHLLSHRLSLRIATGLALSALVVVCAQPAFAVDMPQPGPNPLKPAQGLLTTSGDVVVLTHKALTSAETVAVQPVVLAGPGAWFAMATRLTVARAAPAGVVAAGAVFAGLAHEPLGFAGRASAGDRALLRIAMHLGALQSARAVQDKVAIGRLTASVRNDRHTFGGLHPKVRTATVALLNGGATTAADAAIQIGELVAMATASAKGKAPRLHGYLAAGLWAGGAVLIASLGGDDGYAMLAEPLALELDKDAAYGGLDRKVAASLRLIAASLREGGKLAPAARCGQVRTQLHQLAGLSRL